MGRRATHTAKGFTLLEVLMAAVLLGAVFVSVMGLLSQSLRNVDRMKPHQRAMLHAREKMTELLLREELAGEHAAGAWDDGYRWEAEITPYELGGSWQGAGYDLFRLRVEVSWGEKDRVKTYVLETSQGARRASTPPTP